MVSLMRFEVDFSVFCLVASVVEIRKMMASWWMGGIRRERERLW